MKLNRLICCVRRAVDSWSSFAAAAENQFQTPKKPVTDEYQGVKVEDDYQWLENDADPSVKAWSDAQNQKTRAYIDKLPDRAAIEKQLTEWYAKTSPSYSGLVSRPGILFALKFQPPKQQQMLVTLKSADDLKSEKVVLDPNALDAKGTTAIDWFDAVAGRKICGDFNFEGRKRGWDAPHLRNSAPEKRCRTRLRMCSIPTAGGSAAWNADGTGIYYTRFPRKGERPDADLNFYQQVYFHKLGTPDSEDTYSIGKEFPRIAEIKLEASRDGKFILATVANGDGGDFAHYLLGPDGQLEATHAVQRSDQSGTAGTRQRALSAFTRRCAARKNFAIAAG